MQLGVVPLEPVAGAVLLQQLAAWPPSRARSHTTSGRARAGPARTPSGPARRGSAGRRRCRAGPRRTCVARSRYSSCSWMAVSLRPSVSVTVWFRVGSCEMARRPETAPSTVRSTRDEPLLDHRQHQGGGADLEVRRHLGEVGVADDHVQPAVLLRVRVRLVAGVDDRSLQRGLEAHLDLEVVGPLAELEAVVAAVLADADPPGAADDLTAHEERREVAHDVGERRRAPHQVVLVGAVRRPLVVGVVLVQDDRGAAGQLAGSPRRVEHHLLPRLVPANDVERVGHLGRGVLGVGVVDVQAGTVGEDDVGQPHVLVGQLARVGDLAGHVEAPGVAQRRLLLEVPARPPGPDRRGGVGVDHLRRGHHRVGERLPLHRDAVLHLGAHDPAHAHDKSVRSTRLLRCRRPAR